MRKLAGISLAGVAAAVSVFLLEGYGPQSPSADQSAAANSLAAITVDYPAEGSLFPPDITPPTFLWRDAAASATSWAIDVTFADNRPAVRVRVPGAPMRVGEIDDSYNGYVPPVLTPEQAAAHTWKPDAATWAAIKTRSGRHPARVVINGFRDENASVSRGQVAIEDRRAHRVGG